MGIPILSLRQTLHFSESYVVPNIDESDRHTLLVQ